MYSLPPTKQEVLSVLGGPRQKGNLYCNGAIAQMIWNHRGGRGTMTDPLVARDQSIAMVNPKKLRELLDSLCDEGVLMSVRGGTADPALSRARPYMRSGVVYYGTALAISQARDTELGRRDAAAHAQRTAANLRGRYLTRAVAITSNAEHVVITVTPAQAMWLFDRRDDEDLDEKLRQWSTDLPVRGELGRRGPIGDWNARPGSTR